MSEKSTGLTYREIRDGEWGFNARDRMKFVWVTLYKSALYKSALYSPVDIWNDLCRCEWEAEMMFHSKPESRRKINEFWAAVIELQLIGG